MIKPVLSAITIALLLSSCAQYDGESFIHPINPDRVNVQGPSVFGVGSIDSVTAQTDDRMAEEERLAVFARSRVFIAGLERRGIDPLTDTARLLIGNETAVVVNVASQTLRLYRNGEVVLDSPVVVGTVNHKTPMFSAKITGVKLHPNWTVPAKQSIEKRYTEKVVKDGGVELKKLGIVWRARDDGSYQFSQPAGSNNVLGLAKFVMYSPTNVYLHDTNRRDLFSHPTRTYSSGCVRVEHWDSLAAELFNIDLGSFQTKLTNKRTRIERVESTTIHIVYWTREIIDGMYYEWDDPYSYGDRTYYPS